MFVCWCLFLTNEFHIEVKLERKNNVIHDVSFLCLHAGFGNLVKNSGYQTMPMMQTI